MRNSLFNELKKRANNLKREVIALYFAFHNPETPFIAKLLIGITISYAFSPIDLIPDFIPILGYLDDLIILPLLIMLSIKLIPGDVLEESRKKANEITNVNKKAGWITAVIIVCFWIVLFGMILYRLFLN